MMNSKEIARELGISSHTVDERLKRAVAVLGVSTRFEAARAYAGSAAAQPAMFAWDGHQSLTYQSPGVADPPSPFMFGASPGTEGRWGDEDRDELHEAFTPYFAASDQPPSRLSMWSAFLEGAWENRLSPGARIASIILIAVLAVFGMGALISLVEGLSRLA